MWTQPKKSKQYDRMGDILMNSDFKKSLTKAMLKGRKRVYCWESRLKKKKKQLSNVREKAELTRSCFVVIFSIMKLYLQVGKMSEEIKKKTEIKKRRKPSESL